MYMTMMRYTLEVIAFTIESCAIIEQAGAHRIELCDNPAAGGTTPSYGMIKAARNKAGIDLFVMIRPRGGDFLYSADEFSIMLSDIQTCKQLGCDGVVLGLLQKDGSIDVLRTAQLVELAYPMEVTFHRAFDHCAAPFEALEQLVAAGCQRILTSGQQPQAAAGAGLIAQLVKAASNRIIIMPGSGINANNIAALAEQTGAAEFHASLRCSAPTGMHFIPPAFPDAAESLACLTTDAKAIRGILHQLNSLA
jgi:copper homeostasis protein